MNTTKAARKALRQRLADAIASVLTATPEADVEKVRKALRKSASKLARKAIGSAAKAKKGFPTQPTLQKEAASLVATEGQNNRSDSKKDKRKQRDKQAALATTPGKPDAQLIS